MEKNQSPRTFNKIQGKTNARLNKRESSRLANEVANNISNAIADNSKKLSMKQAFAKAWSSVLRWFGFGKKDRNIINLGKSGTIKKTNKEAKTRSAKVRKARNVARNSRKVNGHRGKRKCK